MSNVVAGIVTTLHLYDNRRQQTVNYHYVNRRLFVLNNKLPFSADKYHVRMPFCRSSPTQYCSLISKGSSEVTTAAMDRLVCTIG